MKLYRRTMQTNAKIAGLDGVVCSPLEAGKVKDVCGKDFLTVTWRTFTLLMGRKGTARITTLQKQEKSVLTTS